MEITTLLKILIAVSAVIMLLLLILICVTFRKKNLSGTDTDVSALTQILGEQNYNQFKLNKSEYEEIKTYVGGRTEYLTGLIYAGNEKFAALLQQWDKEGRESTQKFYGEMQESAKRDNAAQRGELNLSIQSMRKELNDTLQLMRKQLEEKLNGQALENKTALILIKESVAKELQTQRMELAQSFKDTRDLTDKQLTEMRNTVDEKLTSTLNTRIDASFKRISESLDNVHTGLGKMQALTDNVTTLNKVFTNIKTRGSWGEVSLESLLDQLMSPKQYIKQAILKGSEKVDFAIIMPGKGDESVLLPIDVKFPREDYDRLLDASEKADKAGADAARASLFKRVREQAKDISTKYILPPKTTDFAVMYLPTEGLFAEIVREVGFAEKLQNDLRVTVAGPTTLTALINSLQIGFRTMAIQKHSSEVWKLLVEFRKQFNDFSGLLEKAKNKAEGVVKEIEASSDRSRIIQKKLSKVDAIAELTGGDDDEN